MNRITLKSADNIANSCLNFAILKGYAPITVVILDDSGNTVVTKRMDGCSPVGIPLFAHAKANTCIIMKTTSREFRDKYTAENNAAKFCQMNSMVNISAPSGGMAPFPGGVLIYGYSDAAEPGDRVVIGAIGVSGAAGDEDEKCALAGKHSFEDNKDVLDKDDIEKLDKYY